AGVIAYPEKSDQDNEAFARCCVSLRTEDDAVFEKNVAEAQVLVIAGPSGAGKSTYRMRLLQEYPERFMTPVLATTRQPHPGEIEGRDHYFMDDDAFTGAEDRGEFVLVRTSFNLRYAVFRAELEDAITSGKTLLIETSNMQTVVEIKQFFPAAKVITILPCSCEQAKRMLCHAEAREEIVHTLSKRLTGRAPVSDEELGKRLEQGIRWFSELFTAADVVIENEYGRDHEKVYTLFRKSVFSLCRGTIEDIHEDGCRDVSPATMFSGTLEDRIIVCRNIPGRDRGMQVTVPVYEFSELTLEQRQAAARSFARWPSENGALRRLVHKKFIANVIGCLENNSLDGLITKFDSGEEIEIYSIDRLYLAISGTVEEGTFEVEGYVAISECRGYSKVSSTVNMEVHPYNRSKPSFQDELPLILGSPALRFAGVGGMLFSWAIHKELLLGIEGHVVKAYYHPSWGLLRGEFYDRQQLAALLARRTEATVAFLESVASTDSSAQDLLCILTHGNNQMSHESLLGCPLVKELWETMSRCCDWRYLPQRAEEILSHLKQEGIEGCISNESFVLEVFLKKYFAQEQSNSSPRLLLGNAHYGTENIEQHAGNRGIALFRRGVDAGGCVFVEYGLFDCGPGFVVEPHGKLVPLHEAVQLGRSFGPGGRLGEGLYHQLHYADQATLVTFHNGIGRIWHKDDESEMQWTGDPIVAGGSSIIVRAYAEKYAAEGRQQAVHSLAMDIPGRVFSEAHTSHESVPYESISGETQVLASALLYHGTCFVPCGSQQFMFRYYDQGVEGRSGAGTFSIHAYHREKVVGYVDVIEDTISYSIAPTSLDGAGREAIFVSPRERKQYRGIGRSLLALAMGIVSEKGFTDFRVLHSTCNGFYEHLGFVSDDTKSNSYEYDLVPGVLPEIRIEQGGAVENIFPGFIEGLSDDDARIIRESSHIAREADGFKFVPRARIHRTGKDIAIQKGNANFCAFIAGELAGVLTYLTLQGVALQTMVVPGPFQRRGAGVALLLAACKEAALLDCKEISVIPDVRSIGFYLRA
ncbi:MAG TPA: GNAT family N-acetyltransferase, partial [Candidatus Omnitrophota bacterium]|nr:GNAT family N-acetyltransferase [Candidatus Omnitrophota bacterium]